MKLDQIINNLSSQDLYKFSMGQAIYHQFSDYKTTWTFKCRNKDVFFTHEMVEEIRDQIEAYCNLRFTEDELAYIDSIKWIKGSYVDFLRLWRPRYEDFEITTNSECGLSIETKGTWLNTSMYEIPVLAIVNEVYFRMKYDYNILIESFKKRLDEKYDMLKQGHWYAGTFSEFGLRRRLSAEAQELVVEKFSHLNDTARCSSTFVGTSNVYLAKKYGVTPVGTMAHEWIMCVGQGNHKHNPAYINNPITEAMVMQGLEPFDSWEDLYNLIKELREYTEDDVVIYTGYNKDELLDKIKKLSQFKNIIIKYGRYIPNQTSHYDENLGINLASYNQYSERIS